jgi:tryptophanyl-tRNA synthetase
MHNWFRKGPLQHLNYRDVASSTKWEKPLFIQEAKIQEDSMLIPGTNGGKMSKSANNINIFP